ncbi:MAG: YncE family protein [Actinobacteria bacterium]|nr:YncE family protein [Actinomycetota bacterium]
MRRTFFAVLLITSLCVIATPAQSEVVSADTKMLLVKTITGGISPKSVRSSGSGLVSAHNMMYKHSVTIYDANTFELIKTVSDSVQLSKFGHSKYTSVYKGAPVEGTYSPDGKYLYVTNYAMYGKGFNREGHDTCSPASGYDTSFLYRINLASYEIDNVYPVGSVPKVVEVTPDNKYVLVSNWCSYDLKIISVDSQMVVKTIKIGRYPRGIAVSNDSKFAYVAEMGGNRIHVIDLEDFSVSYIPIGSNPRAIVLSPDNSTMYVTMNLSGKVASWDLVNKKAGKSVRTGNAARSLAISSDGTALFVVNFVSDTISKVRASDMKVIQNIKVCNEPIGITYDSPTSRTWVACYGGAIKIFDNK